MNSFHTIYLVTDWKIFDENFLAGVRFANREIREQQINEFLNQTGIKISRFVYKLRVSYPPEDLMGSMAESGAFGPFFISHNIKVQTILVLSF